MKHASIIIILILKAYTCIGQKAVADFPETHFMVFSDPHYYDPSLGTEGEAFQSYLDKDRKLLKQSRELMLEAIDIVAGTEASFVLIPGDLTKDGTRVSHLEFAILINKIKKTGKKVYVVPGNHDVSNGEAHSYRGKETVTVDNVGPDLFKTIYSGYGYNEALYEDNSSLSYVVEPVDGLWVLGLDACLYKQNQPGGHPVTDGAFSPETLQWIEKTASEAGQKGKKMIAFMHHGVVEHYKGQEKFYGEYLVNDHEEVSEIFANLGISVVFTGHYHAQDITMRKLKNGNYIYDVQTGSLVTYPCPVREVRIKNNMMQVSSLFIDKTESYPNGFTSFSKDYVHSGISGIAEKTLISYKLKPEDAAKLSGQVADAFLAHYEGDEVVPEQYLDLSGVGIWGRMIILFKRKLIVGLYNDLPPKDNDITFSLEKP
jgi:predicted phosphodiesterase